MTKNEFYSDLPTLTTERFILRKMHTGDADDVNVYASDPEVSKYLRWDAHPSLTATQEYVHGIPAEYKAGADGPWVIANRDTDKVIGAIHIYEFNEAKRLAEVGYMLGREGSTNPVS